MYLQSMRFLTVNERELIETAVAYAVYHVLPRKSPAPRFKKGRMWIWFGLTCTRQISPPKPCAKQSLHLSPPSTHPHISLCVLTNE